PETIDAQLLSIFQKLLAPNPQNRYADLGLFRKDLVSYISTKGARLDREGLADYLEGLKLAKMQEAISVKQAVKDWQPQASTKILDQTGLISSFAIPPSPKRRYLWTSLAGLVLLSLALLMSPQGQRFLGNKTVPSAAVGAAPSVASGSTPKPQNFQAKVKFYAEPYASVSIAGQFSNLETPFTKTLPPKDYEVSFVHCPSGRKVTALLKASQGGVFSCTANMSQEDPTQAPSAACRAR
ncbi:MAG: hypothetical protein HY073_00395, partial [Deltaproteobacteria bacterium]|nr:hypothetical protein [Deltaproteobacteria bacterium]